MKDVYIMTVVGEGSPQLIKSLAETTRAMGGEWLNSKVIKLDHQFAAMMRVAVEPDKAEALEQELARSYGQLQFTYAPALKDDPEHSELVSLSFDSEDRPGLTHDITKILSDLSLHTEHLEFRRLPVIPLGGTVYNARMDVCLPESISKEELVETLEAISSSARVNFV